VREHVFEVSHGGQSAFALVLAPLEILVRLDIWLEKSVRGHWDLRLWEMNIQAR
jgi:hypothetical protein